MARKKSTFEEISEYTNTTVVSEEHEGWGLDDDRAVILYDTVIFRQYNDGMIRLNHGGHKTKTTKKRMNECLMAANIPYKVVQRDFSWYVQDKRSGDMVTSWSSESPSVKFKPSRY